MNDVTTYTRRENARCAGVAAGVPAERIKITVHKSDGKVRFGWREVDPGTNGDMNRPGFSGGSKSRKDWSHGKRQQSEPLFT